LGFDPAESPGAVTANYLQLQTVGLKDCLRRAVEISGWNQKHRRLPEGRGVGLACSSYLTGAGVSIYWNPLPHSGGRLKLDRGGGVTLFCGATEIGQGSDDALAAIVAEVLGIHPFDIRVVTEDMDLGPVDLGSYSSRVTLMAGNAALQAPERLRGLLADSVAQHLNVPKERLRFAGHSMYDPEDPEHAVRFQEAVWLAESRFGTLGAVGSYTPPQSPARYKGGTVGPSPTYSYTAAVIEAEVNTATGWVTAKKVWIAHDIGQAVNPALARGQVEGSVCMAPGEALMEEQAFRRLPPKFSSALVHKFPSMLESKSLTSLDMPEVILALVGEPDPQGPFGAKEAGQGPLLPILPALANAVYDAIGVRIDEVPITPDKVLKALEEKKAGRPISGDNSNMLRLPLFQYRAPRTLDEAARILHSEGSPGFLRAGPICCRT
jgi:4-hydroxybenzoyl-CoA reductase subunit alpha